MFSEPKKNIEQFSIDPGMKVADLGSGAGFYSLEAAKATGETGKVFAVDIQQDLLTKLKSEMMEQRIENIDIVWGDFEERAGSTLKEDSIDRVMVVNTLFQAQDKENVLIEAKRILKPKGQLMIIDWSDSFGGIGPQTHHLFKEDQARALIEKVGFEFIRKIEAGDHHYGFISKKI